MLMLRLVSYMYILVYNTWLFHELKDQKRTRFLEVVRGLSGLIGSLSQWRFSISSIESFCIFIVNVSIAGTFDQSLSIFCIFKLLKSQMLTLASSATQWQLDISFHTQNFHIAIGLEVNFNKRLSWHYNQSILLASCKYACIVSVHRNFMLAVCHKWWQHKKKRKNLRNDKYQV